MVYKIICYKIPHKLKPIYIVIDSMLCYSIDTDKINNYK
jgi:hypothetical protein